MAEAATAPEPVAAPAAPAPAAPSPAPAAPGPAPAVAITPEKQSDAEQTALDIEQPWTPDAIPEKFRTKNEAGELDPLKTLEKLTKSYSELEKRASRGGEVRPKTAADYVINAPEAAKEWLTADDPIVKSFLGKAHAAGYTQKQLDLAMGVYAENVAQLVGGARELDRDAAVAKLRETWQTEAEFTTNVQAARRAIEAYGGAELGQAIGNNPAAIRAFAKIGAEMREDTPPNVALPAGDADIDALRMSPAYQNADHPQHAEVSRRVHDAVRRKLGAMADQPV